MKSKKSAYGVKHEPSMILSGKAAEAMTREQEDKAELAGDKLPSLAPGKSRVMGLCLYFCAVM